MGEEQYFPSSLPEPFSHIFQSSEKTGEENGEPFFQCITIAMEPQTVPLPKHSPRRCSSTSGSLTTAVLCLLVPLFPIPVSDYQCFPGHRGDEQHSCRHNSSPLIMAMSTECHSAFVSAGQRLSPCPLCAVNVFILRQERLHLKLKKAKFLLV